MTDGETSSEVLHSKERSSCLSLTQSFLKDASIQYEIAELSGIEAPYTIY